MEADKQTEVLELLEAMIAIPSVNPAYEEGAEGEMELSRFIEQRCRAAGLSVYRQPVLPNRDNLIIELKTGHPQRTLLFEAHMDTVSLGGCLIRCSQGVKETASTGVGPAILRERLQLCFIRWNISHCIGKSCRPICLCAHR